MSSLRAPRRRPRRDAFSLFSHGGFPAGRGTYRNAPTYAEAAVALELSESIEKLLLDDFDDEC